MENECSVPSCTGKIHNKATMCCQKHYVRLKKYNSLMPKRTPPGLPLKWLKQKLLIAKECECIIWKFAKNRAGYGRIVFEGRTIAATKLSLAMFTGDFPSDKIACHKECNNPSCVNPHHLYWGTYSQNQQDKVRDNTHCNGERQYSAKLTTKDVIEIRLLKEQGSSCAELSRQFQMSPGHIWKICRGMKWGWLK